MIPFHPLAEIFPLIEGEEFDALVADIKSHGIREPIWIYDGQIIDGRNQYRAAQIAAVNCPLREYTGDDPVAFVVSLNLKRRHLNESQRAMVAAKLATLERGDNQHSPIGETSQARAAALLNVGKRSVERAREVQQSGVPELQAAVERGVVSVSAASDIASISPEDQHEIVARGEKEILRKATEIRAKKAEVTHAERIAKLIEISGGNTPIGTDRKYPVIYADPPWEHAEGTSTDNRRVDNHYPTMSTQQICELPVRDMAPDTAADAPYTVAEARQKIGRMVKTSLDPNTVIKGTELLSKLDQVDRDRGQTPEDDGFTWWRIERDFLIQPNGATAYVLMHGITNCHLLHYTYSLLMEQEFGPEIWSRLYARLNDGAREDLDRALANPKYQLEARKTIWAEVDIDITTVTVPQHLRRGMNGHKEIAANA